jgi:hypothetical protein
MQTKEAADDQRPPSYGRLTAGIQLYYGATSKVTCKA